MPRRNLPIVASIVVALSYFIVGPNFAEETNSLFSRLGGMVQINAIVNETIDRTSEDPRVARIFEGIWLAPLKVSAAQHLCEISGGPCRYEGAPMRKAHSGLAITSEQFEIMDSYLMQALSARAATPADMAELGQLLNDMKSDVIGK